ncbi:MAG: FixH family protein [Flectobacillus sp.]|nr:FixH family protein [Flectobacillus sp.]
MKNTFTFNWGHSIVLTFVLFALFIGTMVYRMSSQQVDLTGSDYYQKEIAYQEQIDRIQNAKTFVNTKAMNYSPETQTIKILLPTKATKGEVTFFRPSDKHLDFSVPITSKNNSLITLSTASLDKGFWRVQATWSDGAKEYFLEQELTVK